MGRTRPVGQRCDLKRVHDYYLRHFLSVAWLINHFSTFLIGWSRDSARNAEFSAILMKAEPMDGQTDPLIEM